MKIKQLMTFYFSAGSLDKALDEIITRLAVWAGRDVYSGCEVYFDKICDVLEDKRKLGELWARLDGVLQRMTERDRAALKRYGAARTGIDGDEKREIHRAAVKFARRAGGLSSGGEQLYRVLCYYRSLISSVPD